MGFAHISPEYWITTPNNMIPTPYDVQRLDGENNLNGNADQSALNADAHGWYFRPISSCGPNGGIEFKD